NAVDVRATRAGESLTLDTRGGHENVQIGDGDVQNILGDVIVTNTPPGGFTDLVVDNRDAVNAAAAVTVSGSSLIGLAPAAVRYFGSSTDDLTIFGGTSNTTYSLTGSLGGSSLELSTGSGLDTVIVGNNGLIDDTSFPGQVILDGNFVSSRLRFDNRVGPAKTLTVTSTGLGGLTTSGFSFSGFRDVEVDLGDADDQVTVKGATGGAARYTLD